jgi:hypothetical protein
MRNISIVLFLFFALSNCHQQNKKDESKDKEIRKQTYEKLIIQKIDLSGKKELPKRVKIITEILTTSPRYKQLTKGLNEAVVKNGGQFFGISLEGSPYPRIDKSWNYSKTYDFTLYEMYVERQLNTARFSFDPVNKQLYELDEVHEILVPIEFDRSLLLEFNCTL